MIMNNIDNPENCTNTLNDNLSNAALKVKTLYLFANKKKDKNKKVNDLENETNNSLKSDSSISDIIYYVIKSNKNDILEYHNHLLQDEIDNNITDGLGDVNEVFDNFLNTITSVNAKYDKDEIINSKLKDDNSELAQSLLSDDNEDSLDCILPFDVDIITINDESNYHINFYCNKNKLDKCMLDHYKDLQEIIYAISKNDIDYLSNIPNIDNYYPVHIAISENNINMLEYYLNTNNLNTFDDNNETPLMLAIRKGNIDIIIKLINYMETTSNILITNCFHHSAIHYSIIYNRLEVLELLLDMTTYDINNSNLLHFGCYYNHINIVNFLLSKGCDVNKTNSKGQNALYYSILRGNKEIIELLCHNNINIHSYDNYGRNAIHYTALFNQLDILNYLIQYVELNVKKDNLSNEMLLLYEFHKNHDNMILHLLTKFGKVLPSTSFIQQLVNVSNTIHNGIFHESTCKIIEKSDDNDAKLTDSLNWQSVIGTTTTKDYLYQSVIDYISGITSQNPKGILLFGPPRNGKTFIVEALASEFDVPFILIDMSSISTIIQSELMETINNIYTNAIDSKVSIVLIKNVDLLVHHSSDNSFTSECKRALKEFIIQAQSNEDIRSNIILFGSTIYPWDLENDEGIHLTLFFLMFTSVNIELFLRFNERILIDAPDYVSIENLIEKILEDTINNLTKSNIQELARKFDGISSGDINAYVNKIISRTKRNRLTVRQFRLDGNANLIPSMDFPSCSNCPFHGMERFHSNIKHRVGYKFNGFEGTALELLQLVSYDSYKSILFVNPAIFLKYTPIWYKYYHFSWYWTPYEDDRLGWMPVDSKTVFDGVYAGKEPHTVNIEIIKCLRLCSHSKENSHLIVPFIDDEDETMLIHSKGHPQHPLRRILSNDLCSQCNDTIASFKCSTGCFWSICGNCLSKEVYKCNPPAKDIIGLECTSCKAIYLKVSDVENDIKSSSFIRPVTINDFIELEYSPIHENIEKCDINLLLRYKSWYQSFIN